jgi:thiol-disulfide isomerase/thioredoxin
MLSRRQICIGAALAAFFIVQPAIAAEKQNYSAAAFKAAQLAGDPILVEIHATWCPTCKAQEPILAELERDPKFKTLKVFHVDFDSQADAVRKFAAQVQSTLIVFKGKEEKARSVGETDQGRIAALLDKAI